MATIKLTKGAVAFVDDNMLEYLSGFKWHLSTEGYAVHSIDHKNKISMHRLIMATPTGLVTDHINGDKLDNRKVNLRAVTGGENRMNTPKTKGYTRDKNGFRAFFKSKYLGYFKTEEAARAAYLEARGVV